MNYGLDSTWRLQICARCVDKSTRMHPCCVSEFGLMVLKIGRGGLETKKAATLKRCNLLISFGAGGRNWTDMTARVGGFWDDNLKTGDFPSKLIAYISTGYKGHIGLRWLLLVYFRLRQLHFSYTIFPEFHSPLSSIVLDSYGNVCSGQRHRYGHGLHF